MKLTLTAAELHSIAKDSAHYAHKYVWSDGTIDWEITHLDWYVDDEARYGMGADSTMELEAVDLTSEGRKAFVKGFVESAPAWYDFDVDSCLSAPWCAPWFWLVKPDWFDAQYTAREMGARFAAYCVENHESFAESFLIDEA